MKRRELVMIGGGHRKFWTVETKGTVMTCTWGRVGTQGQTKGWVFASPTIAEDNARAKLNEKLAKGYVDAAGGVGSGPVNTTPAGPPDVTEEEMAAARSTLQGVMKDLSDG